MRLKIRAVRLRVHTRTQVCGADFKFTDGLVVLRANNSSGKSTVVQSIIFGLGLEGMLSASHGVPLPHVMTNAIDLPDGTTEPVDASYVTLEIENAKGEIATVSRVAKGHGNTHLVKLAKAPLLTDDKLKPEFEDYYVRVGGAAVNERGFHKWFADFLGWKLPYVARVDGASCPLYVECIFPLMLIEQKRGWSAIQARMPYHYRIREVAKRSFEFLLNLDVNDNALLRQELREENQAIRKDWSLAVERITGILAAINGIPQGIDQEVPKVFGKDDAVDIVVARGGRWMPFKEAIRHDQAELRELEKSEIPRVEKVAQEAEQALVSARSELAHVDFASNELFRAVQQDEQQLMNVDDRLIALEEDQRRNGDLLKLKRLGSTTQVLSANGQCPTCHQTVADSLMPLSQQTPMTAEQNIEFIKAQLETFGAIKKTSAVALGGKKRRLDSLRIRSSELRSSIRSLQKTLVSDGREPSEAAIERRLSLRQSVNAFRRASDAINQEMPNLIEVGVRWTNWQDKMKKLPKGDLSTSDRRKLGRLTEIFVSHVKQFEMTSIDPSSLKISEENYRPEHAGFDLEFDLSASDMIRTIWAYLLSLVEFAGEGKTNHLQLLVLDEPRQQETARSSFRQLFARTGALVGTRQQVIIATSEEEATLKALLGDVPHQFINVEGRIVKPLSKLTNMDATHSSDEDHDDNSLESEMLWEIEAGIAVKQAIDSFDWNHEERVISYLGFDGVVREASSYDDLFHRLCAVAIEAWNSYVPFDGGTPVFECDDDSIVEEHLSPLSAEIQAFFDKR